MAGFCVRQRNPVVVSPVEVPMLHHHISLMASLRLVVQTKSISRHVAYMYAVLKKSELI